MINLGKDSKHKPAQVVEKAIAFFGPGGVGMTVHDFNDGSARFEGGGGFVTVAAKPAARGSEVEVQSNEWEHQAKEFLGKI